MALPGLNEIAASLLGALRLLRRDPRGLANFNMTDEGFWRSFFAIVLVLPLSAFAAIMIRENTEVSAAAIASRTSVNLLLKWAAFTAVMLPFTRSLDLGHNYMRFITAYNWCSVIGAVCMMVPVLLLAMGMLDVGAVLITLAHVILLAMLAYFWFVTREALETSGLVAAAVVFMDLMINITIERFFGLQHTL